MPPVRSGNSFFPGESQGGGQGAYAHEADAGRDVQ